MSHLCAQLQKRPTKETYKRDLCRITREAYRKDLRKRPTKETYKRDLQKRPTKETYKRDLCRFTREAYRKDLRKRPTKETCETHRHACAVDMSHVCTRLQKRPTKETYKDLRETPTIQPYRRGLHVYCYTCDRQRETCHRSLLSHVSFVCLFCSSTHPSLFCWSFHMTRDLSQKDLRQVSLRQKKHVTKRPVTGLFTCEKTNKRDLGVYCYKRDILVSFVAGQKDL